MNPRTVATITADSDAGDGRGKRKMKAEELLTALRVIGPVLVTDRTTGLDYLALAINGVKATVIPVIVGET